MAERPLVQAPYKIRSDLGRKTYGGLACPLGVHPCVKEARLDEGFESRFIMGDDLHDDQCEYRLLLSSERLLEVMRSFFERLLPDEVWGLFEELSYDAYRDSDVYRSVDPVSRERILQAWDTYGEYFVESGKCGFGASAQEPSVEVFIEEHGTLYVGCGLEKREEVEELIQRLGLREIPDMPCIDNYEHQHSDILQVDEERLMDDYDIKFSVVESLGMEPLNLDEGRPAGSLVPFWVYLELDLSFEAATEARGAYVSFGLSADCFDQAMETAEAHVRALFPSALVARVQQVYRLLEDDITPEIAPADPARVREPGIWFVSDLESW